MNDNEYKYTYYNNSWIYKDCGDSEENSKGCISGLLECGD